MYYGKGEASASPVFATDSVAVYQPMRRVQYPLSLREAERSGATWQSRKFKNYKITKLKIRMYFTLYINWT